MKNLDFNGLEDIISVLVIKLEWCFFSFYGPRSVLKAWTNPSPWSILIETKCIMRKHEYKLDVIFSSNALKIVMNCFFYLKFVKKSNSIKW